LPVFEEFVVLRVFIDVLRSSDLNIQKRAFIFVMLLRIAA
jgi:hypothetical protein